MPQTEIFVFIDATIETKGQCTFEDLMEEFPYLTWEDCERIGKEWENSPIE